MQPKAVEVETSFEPDGAYGIRSVWVTKRSFYTAWSDRVIHQMHEAFRPEQLGYRLVDREPVMSVSYYARPWLFWAVLRTRVKVRDWFWRLMCWMYDRRWFHLDRPEGTEFRWRDVRLGKG